MQRCHYVNIHFFAFDYLVSRPRVEGLIIGPVLVALKV